MALTFHEYSSFSPCQVLSSRDIDIKNLAIMSVRPSVRNVPVSDENGLTLVFSPW